MVQSEMGGLLNGFNGVKSSNTFSIFVLIFLYNYSGWRCFDTVNIN